MIFASSNLLGIAVADRTIACAEVSGRGDRANVSRTATFTLPPELSLERPDEVGAAFAAFLKENKFSASRAVIGVPAKWLIAVEKEIPPASADQVQAMLRLQAERLPLADNGDLVFDYAGEHHANAAGKVLLVAMLRRQVERLEQVMAAADVAIVAITPTALALSSIASKYNAKHNLPMVMLGRSGAEVVLQRDGAPRMLRHVAINVANGHGPAIAPLGMELRRAVAMAPAMPPVNGHSAADEEMMLWDGVGLSREQVAELSSRLGVKVRADDGMSMLGMKGQALALATKATRPDVAKAEYAPAIALAMVGSKSTLLPLNFADSKLAPPKVARFGTKTVWGGIIVGALIIGTAAILTRTHQLSSELDEVRAQRLAQRQTIEEAKTLQDRVTTVGGFFEKRSPMLECLRELTETFRDEDPMWTTNFTVNEDRNNRDLGRADGRIEGKTTDWGTAIRLADRMRENPRFIGVRGPDIGNSTSGIGRGNREPSSSFVISFSYIATPVPIQQPATQPGAGPATAPTTSPVAARN